MTPGRSLGLDEIVVLTFCGPSCDTQAQDGVFHEGASHAEFVAACGVRGHSCDAVAQAIVLHEGASVGRCNTWAPAGTGKSFGTRSL